jgi:hypothetical protein
MLKIGPVSQLPFVELRNQKNMIKLSISKLKLGSEWGIIFRNRRDWAGHGAAAAGKKKIMPHASLAHTQLVPISKSHQHPNE